MTAERTEYPFDTDHLRKGDAVPADTIEAAYGVRRDTVKYQLVLLQAVEFVRRRFADRGEIVTITAESASLRILTDEEQVEYNVDQFRFGIRKARRAHARQLGADRSQIANSQLLDAHDRAIEVQGRQLAAVARERRMLPPAPTPRLTPGRREAK